MPSLHVPERSRTVTDTDVTYTLYEHGIVHRLTLPLSILFCVQALILWFFLGEASRWLSLAHVVAGAGLGGIHFLLGKKDFNLKHIHGWSVCTALLPLLAGFPAITTDFNALFTFYAVFCVLGSGCILFSMQWFTLLLSITLPLWMAGTLPSVPSESWPYHGAPLLGAVFVTSAFILARRKTCAHLEALHVRQEVQRSDDAFNRDLFTAMEQSEAAVLIFSQRGRIEYVNLGFTKLTGYAAADALGNTPEYLLENRNMWRSVLRKLPSERGWQGDLSCLNKDGRPFWCHISITPIFSESGEVLRYSCVAEDITQMKLAHREMERLAFHDNLTGLNNRRLILDRLDQAMRESLRNGDFQGLLYLDLDRFKEINDTYGHDAGDILLKEVARRLMNLVRAEDSVGRMGGDEFVVLLKRVESPEAAAHVASKILRRITQPIDIKVTRVTISTSIGIAMAPTDGHQPQVLLKHADMAMYQAKAQGRNCYSFFTPKLNEAHTERHNLEVALRQALAKEQFLLLFQPWVDVQSRRICGVEALLRWQHPEQGLLQPPAFIDILEKMEIVIPLSHWVIRRTGEYLAQMRSRGFGDLPASVNMSSRQLLDPQLPNVIAEVIRSCHFQPSCLELEVSECVFCEYGPETSAAMERLKKLGVRLVLDNYGTSKLSPVQLAELNVDLIKVDRSFVKDLPVSSACVDITSAMIAMAHELHIPVVAGGVETDDQVDFLDSHACDFAQGFRFYQPLKQDEVMTLFQQNRIGQAG